MADEAFRLIVTHDESGIELKSIERIDMRVPPPDAPEDDRSISKDRVGFFAELRSDEGRPLYIRSLPDEDARMLEFPTGDPTQEFGWVRSPQPVPVSVLVPALSDARSVAFVQASPRRWTFFWNRSRRRRDLAVFPLPSLGTRDGHE